MSNNQYFVEHESIVRRIWGNGDTVLLIFAGASAEFALNKAVDWLYFTGKLPADPLGRLFSTVVYSQRIVFSKEEDALKTISSMSKIHQQVEEKRGYAIPQWAYRDVLFMLIDYSIRSYEVLEGRMSAEDKEEVFRAFHRLGKEMEIEELPDSFEEWLPVRNQHLRDNYEKSELTKDLVQQYRKHLGGFRFFLLKESYALTVPPQIKNLLSIHSFSLLRAIVPMFNFSKKLGIDWFFKQMLFPKKYHDQIRRLDFGQ